MASGLGCVYYIVFWSNVHVKTESGCDVQIRVIYSESCTWLPYLGTCFGALGHLPCRLKMVSEASTEERRAWTVHITRRKGRDVTKYDIQFLATVVATGYPAYHQNPQATPDQMLDLHMYPNKHIHISPKPSPNTYHNPSYPQTYILVCTTNPLLHYSVICFLAKSVRKHLSTHITISSSAYGLIPYSLACT